MTTLTKKKRDKYPKDGYKGQRKTKVMNVIWYIDSDESNNDSDNKSSQSQEINFAIMKMVEDISNSIDVKTIIAIKT
jgi:hypothetical protein